MEYRLVQREAIGHLPQVEVVNAQAAVNRSNYNFLTPVAVEVAYAGAGITIKRILGRIEIPAEFIAAHFPEKLIVQRKLGSCFVPGIHPKLDFAVKPAQEHIQ